MVSTTFFLSYLIFIILIFIIYISPAVLNDSLKLIFPYYLLECANSQMYFCLNAIYIPYEIFPKLIISC